mgnify:CR=1 FL=1
MEKITAINIDDAIKEKRRKGITKIFWSEEEFSILLGFIEAATTKIGWCGEFLAEALCKFKEDGVEYMGVKHFKKI